MIKKVSGVGYVAAWCLAAMVIVLVVEVQETAAVACDPIQLSPCLPSITGPQPPSQECCAKLKEQVPCYCKYSGDPALKPYIDSPRAKEVAKACSLTFPKC